MKTFKTALSLFLALCMVMSLGGVTAFADIEVKTSDEGTGPQLGILEGEATISYTDSSGGPHVPPDPGVSITVPVVPDPAVPPLDPGNLNLGSVTASAEKTVIEGDITAEGQEWVTGLVVSSINDSNRSVTGESIIGENAGTVTVTGGITANAVEGQGSPTATGVDVNWSNAEITIGAAVSAKAAEGGTTGIGINNAASQYNAGVTVNGDVTASGRSGTGVTAQAPGNGARAEVTVNGNVTTEDSNGARGLFANGAGATVTVNGGDVRATSTDAEGTGIYAGNGSTVSVKAGEGGKGGNVSGSTTGVSTYGTGTSVAVSGTVSGGDTGVNARSGSEVTVGGDVTGTNNKGVIASGEETTVKVTGDVTGGNTGVMAESGSEVTVGRDVTSTNGTGVSANGEGTTVEVTGSVSGSNTGVIASSGSEVTVGGNVEGTSDTGVAASGGSKVTVGTIDEAGNFTGSKVTGGNHGIGAGGEGTTVNDGDVTSNPSGFGTGIWAYDSASVTAGDVTTNGIGVKSDGGSSVIVGDVEAGSTGISAENSTVTAGNVTTTGETAVAVSVTGSKVEVKDVTGGMTGIIATGDSNVKAGKVEGDSGIMANDSTVSAESVTATDGMGVRAEDGSTVKVGTTDEAGNFTAGDVKSENGIGIKADGGSTVTAGDVKGATAGVKVDGAATVTIDGTLTVTGGTPILLGDAVTESEAGNINISVWEIQGAENGNVVSGGQDANAAAAVQQNIDYVIKVAPDETSQSVFGEYKNHDKTTKSGPQQQIKVTVPENYTLKAAFATDGTAVPITKGEDGSYYATIPASGGIYLHAEIEQLPEPQPEPEPKPDNPKPQPKPDDPKPQPKPQPKSEAMNFVISWVEEAYTGSGKVETASVSFDLNGGQTIRGGKGPIVKEVPVDTWLRLLEAPVKEGATFAGWKCSDPSVTETKPGYAFRVTHSVSFTALWE